MKTLVSAALFACAGFIGLEMVSNNSALAQAGTTPVIAIPLTNNDVFPFANVLGFTNTLPGGFTNTVVRPANFSALRLTNMVTLLLSLQTNIEETLPVLGVLTSNANVAIPSGAAEVPAAVVPITSAPAGLFLPPTGQVSGADRPVIFMNLGTNTVEIDPPTFQALVLLRDDLEQTLPVLQMLNGTAPKETNVVAPSAPTMTPLTNSFSPVDNFGFAPLSSGFAPPLTNQAQLISNPSPF